MFGDDAHAQMLRDNFGLLFQRICKETIIEFALAIGCLSASVSFRYTIATKWLVPHSNL